MVEATTMVQILKQSWLYAGYTATGLILQVTLPPPLLGIPIQSGINTPTTTVHYKSQHSISNISGQGKVPSHQEGHNGPYSPRILQLLDRGYG